MQILGKSCGADGEWGKFEKVIPAFSFTFSFPSESVSLFSTFHSNNSNFHFLNSNNQGSSLMEHIYIFECISLFLKIIQHSKLIIRDASRSSGTQVTSRSDKIGIGQSNLRDGFVTDTYGQDGSVIMDEQI
ncbi:uncharacterized protein LOC120068560 [Benincasa hispida]|uniref:uncharacterized protein LOC120068560 n=1 Tax=Benincasa hispida TaxID=102211 RepID=UPI001902533C|nr:uncharacterized protein LOC120068560 [Benincasa hispida]